MNEVSAVPEATYSGTPLLLHHSISLLYVLYMVMHFSGVLSSSSFLPYRGIIGLNIVILAKLFL